MVDISSLLGKISKEDGGGWFLSVCSRSRPKKIANKSETKNSRWDGIRVDIKIIPFDVFNNNRRVLWIDVLSADTDDFLSNLCGRQNGS